MNLQRYLKYRLVFESLFSLLLVALITVINATTIMIEARRAGTHLDAWLPWIQEGSSGLAVLMLLPLIILVCARVPINLAHPGRLLALHSLMFLFFSSAHLFLLEGLRAVLLPMAGIDAGTETLPWWERFVYEARKDVLVYLLIVSLIYAYEFILNRLQGEAGFLHEPSYASQFLVKMLNREFLVKTADIHWLQSARNYVLLKCDMREYPMRATMREMEERLDPAVFRRCHRTAIVNLDRIAALHSHSGDAFLELKNGDRVPLSQTYLGEIRQAMANETEIHP